MEFLCLCLAVTAAIPCSQMMLWDHTSFVHILKNTNVALSSFAFPLV